MARAVEPLRRLARALPGARTTIRSLHAHATPRRLIGLSLTARLLAGDSQVPLLGAYNSQATMDAEIVAAAEAGVDFFQMLWYDDHPERAPNARLLNRGVRAHTPSTVAYDVWICSDRMCGVYR